MPILKQDGNRLIYHYDTEQLWIEAWGQNSLRVRATKQNKMLDENWALIAQPECKTRIEISEAQGEIQNGNIKAVISRGGFITIYNADGKELMREYTRNRRDLFSRTCSALEIEAREFKPIFISNV